VTGLNVASLVEARVPLLVSIVKVIALAIACFLAIKVTGQRAVIRHEVEEAERRKWNQMLLSNVAHEIRTPLTVILGYTQRLQRDPRLPAPFRGTIVTIESSAQRLRQSVDDLAERWKPGGGDTA